jgi:glycosyltransferase involved in cell wall biosynthesis
MLGLFVKKHARAAISSGYRISVAFARQASGEQSKNIEIHGYSDDFLSETIVTYPARNGFPGLLLQIRAWLTAISVTRKAHGKPQLIHAHVLTRTGLLAMIYSVFYRIPYVVTEHWSRYYPENIQFKGFWHKWITKKVLQKARSVSVVSQRLAEAMKSTGLNFSYEIIGNVVDTGLFTPSETKEPGEIRKIISISCFEEKSKNLNLLLDAFQELLSKTDNIQLVLVGDGADFEYTRKRVSEMNFKEGDVRFTGMLENEALAEELRGSACLALSSNYETFAISVFEALACGVPVVVTDVADLIFHIKEEMGEVVEAGNMKDFSAALSKVIENARNYNANTMRDYVERNFGAKAIAEQLNFIYKPLINNSFHHAE